MINPHYFTDRTLQVGFNITVENHRKNHANSKLTIKPNNPEFGIEVHYINKIMKELSVIYATLIKSIYIQISNSIISKIRKTR